MSVIQVGDNFTNNQGCKAIVIEYINSRKVLIEFLDNHQHRMFVEAADLRKGNFKNPYMPNVYGVGYIGYGKHKAKLNGKHFPVYRAWHSMLQRCYDEKLHKNRPTYQDCIVCPEWHNFQVFADWYLSQANCNDGYHLDKDLLVEGNKVYSPETCVLAPIEINALLGNLNSSRGDLPVGVGFDKRDCTYSAQLNIDNVQVRIGTFSNPQDASQAYQAAKKANIKRMALEWQDRIDKRLFDALMAKAA